MELKDLKINDLIKGYNPRKNRDLISLKESITKLGVLVPLLVRPKENKFEVVCGESRWIVAKQLNIKLPCIVKELTDEEAANISYIDNKERNDLTPIEEAKHYAFMRDTYKYSAQQLADRYGVSRGTIDQYWSISKLPDTFQHVLELSFRHLYEISKLVDKEELIKVFEEGFGVGLDKWDEQNKKDFDIELKAREEEQIKLANIIIENELSVKQTEREVKNILYRFEERNKHIKLKASEKINNALKALRDGISKITNTSVHLCDGFNSFSNVMTLFSKELFNKIPEKEKNDLLGELQDLEDEVNKLDLKEIKEDIAYFKSNIGGRK